MVVTDLRSALAASYRVSHVLVSGCGDLDKPVLGDVRVSGWMRGSGCLRISSGSSLFFFKRLFSMIFLDVSSVTC